MEGKAIRKALRVRGHSFTAIAQLLSVSVMQVSRVAYRTRNSHRVALAIATALDKPISQVFPDKPEYQRPYETAAERHHRLANQLRDQNLIGQRV